MVRKHLKILCPVKTCFSKFKLQNRKPFVKGGTLIEKDEFILISSGFTAASFKRGKKGMKKKKTLIFYRFVDAPVFSINQLQ